MRPRIPSGNPERSLAEKMEYGLTAALVLVVVAAVFQICGIHPKWMY
jgi:Flp pilus assembly pilin Flp